MVTFSDRINDFFKAEKWSKARKLIEARLIKRPDDHFLLTRLATTYYEEKQYEKALELCKEALKEAPFCPLVRWDLAGVLKMVGRGSEAMHIWKGIIRRSTESLAFGSCGEGISWARSLQNDCRYCLADMYRQEKKYGLSQRFIVGYIAHRQKGVKSIYSLRKAKKMLGDVQLLRQKGGRSGRGVAHPRAGVNRQMIPRPPS